MVMKVLDTQEEKAKAKEAGTIRYGIITFGKDRSDGTYDVEPYEDYETEEERDAVLNELWKNRRLDRYSRYAPQDYEIESV